MATAYSLSVTSLNESQRERSSHILKVACNERRLKGNYGNVNELNATFYYYCVCDIGAIKEKKEKTNKEMINNFHKIISFRDRGSGSIFSYFLSF